MLQIVCKQWGGAYRSICAVIYYHNYLCPLYFSPDRYYVHLLHFYYILTLSLARRSYEKHVERKKEMNPEDKSIYYTPRTKTR